jgi:hypothetical protein
MSNIEESAELRRAARIALPLPVRVELQESDGKKWKEVTNLTSASNIGAGFISTRKIEVGRMVLLSLPLPRQMRFYDERDTQYEVWALVRHCQPRSLLDSSAFYVGVAFTGKFPPAGYSENPFRLYKICGVKDNGLWEVTADGMSLSTRKHSRYSIPVEIFVAKLDAEKNMLSGERTVTENISVGGASVLSNLKAEIGEYVKVISDRYNFSSLAVVRNQRVGDDNLPRLHLEFVELQFPLEGIE